MTNMYTNDTKQWFKDTAKSAVKLEPAYRKQYIVKSVAKRLDMKPDQVAWHCDYYQNVCRLVEKLERKKYDHKNHH